MRTCEKAFSIISRKKKSKKILHLVSVGSFEIGFTRDFRDFPIVAGQVFQYFERSPAIIRMIDGGREFP